MKENNLGKLNDLLFKQMNEKKLLKSEDCLYCICIECNQKFNTDIESCSYSDCKWCEDEIGQYTENCRLYIDKGGSYE